MSTRQLSNRHMSIDNLSLKQMCLVWNPDVKAKEFYRIGPWGRQIFCPPFGVKGSIQTLRFKKVFSSSVFACHLTFYFTGSYHTDWFERKLFGLGGELKHSCSSSICSVIWNMVFCSSMFQLVEIISWHLEDAILPMQLGQNPELSVLTFRDSNYFW